MFFNPVARDSPFLVFDVKRPDMQTIKRDRKANLTGAFWMVFAMAAFAIEDVYIKAASTVLPVSQVLVLFGLGGAMVFLAAAIMRGESILSRAVISRPMQIRVLFEIAGRLFFVLAIALSSLSSATVILQATPVFVVAGAAIFFGERVGLRRWLAIIVGLIGVIVIVQPGASGFTPVSLLAVAGMLGFAGRDLASRAAPLSLSTAVLGFYGFLAIVVAGALYRLRDTEAFYPVTAEQGMVLGGAVFSGVAAYACLMKAMRTGEVAAVTPFRYTRLIFGVACGVVLFNEQLTLSVMIGCSLIVFSGLFIIVRQDKRGAPAGR